jgi:hypothetical protein
MILSFAIENRNTDRRVPIAPLRLTNVVSPTNLPNTRPLNNISDPISLIQGSFIPEIAFNLLPKRTPRHTMPRILATLRVEKDASDWTSTK